MSNYLNNEKGLTLIELLPVIAISAMIILFSTLLIVQTLNNQEKIAVEQSLRDEADVILASLMKDVFTLPESSVARVECGIEQNNVQTPLSCVTEMEQVKQQMQQCGEQQGCKTYALIYLKDHKKIGFYGEMIYTREQSFSVSNERVVLDSYYTIERVERNAATKQPAYIISFTLRHTGKNTTRMFRNELLTVNDL